MGLFLKILNVRPLFWHIQLQMFQAQNEKDGFQTLEIDVEKIQNSEQTFPGHGCCHIHFLNSRLDLDSSHMFRDKFEGTSIKCLAPAICSSCTGKQPTKKSCEYLLELWILKG